MNRRHTHCSKILKDANAHIHKYYWAKSHFKSDYFLKVDGIRFSYDDNQVIEVDFFGNTHIWKLSCQTWCLVHIEHETYDYNFNICEKQKEIIYADQEEQKFNR